jgi:ATP-dependent DNA ligase
LGIILANNAPGIRLNAHIEDDGPIVFRHACKLGLEGILARDQRRLAPLD